MERPKNGYETSSFCNFGECAEIARSGDTVAIVDAKDGALVESMNFDEFELRKQQVQAGEALEGVLFSAAENYNSLDANELSALSDHMLRGEFDDLQDRTAITASTVGPVAVLHAA